MLSKEKNTFARSENCDPVSVCERARKCPLISMCLYSGVFTMCRFFFLSSSFETHSRSNQKQQIDVIKLIKMYFLSCDFFWVSLLMSMVFVVCPGAQFGHFICHCINRVKSLTHQRMPIDFVSSKKCNRSIRDCFWMFFLDLNDNLNSWIAKTWQSKAKQRGEQKKLTKLTDERI